MRRIFCSTLFLILACIMPLQSSHAKADTNQSCKLLDLILEQGIRGGNKQLAIMSEWMPEPTKSQIGNAMTLVQGYEFLDGSVFMTGKLSTHFEEHLIVLEVKDNVPIYIRLFFENVSNELRLANFFLDSPFVKSSSHGAFLQTPELIECM